MKGRASSVMRRAFALAADGRQKSIALDAYPDLSPEVAAARISRVLSADGDLNASWVTLDLIGEAHPEAVLRALCEAWGFRAPERVAAPAEESLARIATGVEAAREALDQLELELGQVRRERERRPALRVGPREPARKRA